MLSVTLLEFFVFLFFHVVLNYLFINGVMKCLTSANKEWNVNM